MRETVRRYYDLVDAGGLDGLLALFHPEVRYERGGREPIEGIDALRRFEEAGSARRQPE